MEQILSPQSHSDKTLGINQYIIQLTKTCFECGKTFVGDGRKKYCSKQCKYTNKVNKIKMKYREKAKKKKLELSKIGKIYTNDLIKFEKIQEKNNIKKKQYIPLPIQNKICKNCNNKFLSNKKRKKFCSIICNKEWFKKRNSLIPFEEKIKNSFLKLRFEIFKKDNFMCQYCGRNPKDNKCKLVIDHIIPRALGGTNDINNLTTSCESCNLGKRDILLENRQLNKEMIIYETKI